MSKLTISLVALVAVLAVTLGALYADSMGNSTVKLNARETATGDALRINVTGSTNGFQGCEPGMKGTVTEVIAGVKKTVDIEASRVGTLGHIFLFDEETCLGAADVDINLGTIPARVFVDGTASGGLAAKTLVAGVDRLGLEISIR